MTTSVRDQQADFGISAMKNRRISFFAGIFWAKKTKNFANENMFPSADVGVGLV
jgi:hypothetical protein